MNFARRVLPGISAALAGGILSAGIAAANPIFDGRYADPQIRLYGDAYWIFPTASAPFGMQTSFDAFSSRDMKTWTKHPRILTTNEVTWAKGAMWAPDAHEVGGKYGKKPNLVFGVLSDTHLCSRPFAGKPYKEGWKNAGLGRQGYVVKVYDDMLAIERREFGEGGSLGTSGRPIATEFKASGGRTA